MSVKRWLRGAACAMALSVAMHGWPLSGTVAAEEAGPIPEAENRVVNGGFESGKESPWGKTADLFYVTDEAAYKGQYSYKLQGRLGELDSSWPNQKATVQVEAGKDYLAYFHALSDFGAMDGDPKVAIKVVPVATSSPTLGQVEIGKAQGDGTWKRYSFAFNSGDLTAVRLLIAEHGGTHYFDEFAIIEAPAAIRASEPSYALGVGGTAVLEAIAVGDEEVKVTAYTAFVSSNPEVASIDASGTVRGLAEGTATITMTCGTATAQVDVVVSGRELTGLRFDQSVYELIPGGTADTIVEAVYGDGGTATVTDGATYSSGDPGVVAISGGGRIEAVGIGTATIAAVYAGRQATAVVRVAEPADPPEQLTIKSPSPTVEVGQTLSLTALAVSGGETVDVTAGALWTAEDESAAAVSLSGVLTAKAPGWTVVQATYGGVTASQAIAVNGLTNGGFENATSSPWTLGDGFAIVEDHALARSGSKSLSLKGSGVWKYARQTVAVSPNTDYALIWHAVSDFAESVGTVSDPKVTVKMTGDTGTVMEYEMLDDSDGVWSRHSFLFNSGANSVLNLYISEHGGNHRFDDFLLVEARQLSGIGFGAASYDVPLGGSARTIVTGQYAHGLEVDISRSAAWSVADTGVAKAGSGVRTGVIAGETLGVTKAIAAFGGYEAETEIRVVPWLQEVRLQGSAFRLTEGGERRLAVIAGFMHGDVEVTADAVYASSDPAVAAVDADGTVTGIGFGTATIHVEYGGYRTEATITVNMLLADPDELVLPVGQTAEIAIYREWPDGSTTEVTAEAELTIADPETASLSGGQAVGVAIGETVLEAAYDGHRIFVPVRVVPAIVGIEWDTENSRLLPGGERAAIVRAIYSDGRREEIDPALIAWSSSEPDVAQIDADGHIRALSLGAAELTAAYETYEATSTVRVVPRLVSPVVWTDGAGGPVTEWTAGSMVHAHAELSAIEPSGAIFVLALYDRQGALVRLVSQSVEASPEAAAAAELGMKMPDETSGMRLQWMVWSDWDGRVPLAPASMLNGTAE